MLYFTNTVCLEQQFDRLWVAGSIPSTKGVGPSQPVYKKIFTRLFHRATKEKDQKIDHIPLASEGSQ